MTLEPELTRLDREVLGAVQRPGRVGAVTQRVRREDAWQRPLASWRNVWPTDVEQILRGLERMGYVRKGRGGWWHRTDRGRVAHEG